MGDSPVNASTQTTTKNIRFASHSDTPLYELAETEGSHSLLIRHQTTQETVGAIQSEGASTADVLIYEGKSGLSVVVTSSLGVRYFGLPGSSVSVEGITVSLQGDPIGQSQNNGASGPTAETQTVTAQATILGAGLATRFEPVSGETTQYAKPAVPLAGDRSVILCITDVLAKHGFSSVFINTFYMPDSLKASLKPSPIKNIQYLDEDQPSGTAGGLRKAIENPALGILDPAQPVLVVQGDAVTDADFSGLLQAHQEQNALITIGCQYIGDEDVDKFGIVVTDQAGSDQVSGSVQGFMEKPALAEAGSHRLANTGFYVFAPEAYPMILACYEAKRQAAGTGGTDEIDLDFAKDIFPYLMQQIQSGATSKTFWAQKVSGYWCDIGNPAQYVQSIHDIYAGKADLVMPETAGEYYDQGILYWPGAKKASEAEKPSLSGNVIVALPYQPTNS
ncbi:MAG: nucleotidyltransferase family protein [Vampirovibrio sp.]|nr:nucleotidyltransferase family protein [Vampirovibrio sp.]